MSKLADILLRVLEFTSADPDDCADYGGFLIFGKKAFDNSAPSEPQPKGDRMSPEQAQRLSNLLMTYGGEAEASRRTAKVPREPEDPARFIAGLPPADRELLFSQLERRSSFQQTEEQARGAPTDLLDSYYAREVLEKLQLVLFRVSWLERITLKGVPPNVQAYIDEAHACFLYGFEVASAVLCRAVLERAVKEALGVPDPEERGSGPGTKKPRRDSLPDLIERRWPSPADPNEKEPEAKVAALLVKDLGNSAIHNLPEFQRKSQEIRHSLTEIRRVLQDCYNAK
jgi:hypothetical protein